MLRGVVILVVAAALGRAQTTPPTGKPGSAAGRVIDAQTGDGIPGATVRLFPRLAAGRFQPPTTSSLADGSFFLPAVEPGSYTIFVQSRGFTSAGSSPIAITVTEGGAVVGLSLKLNPLGSVSGRVVDEKGRPVPAADVELFRSARARGRLQLSRINNAETAKNGFYTFGRVPPGRYLVSASADESARSFYGRTLHFEEAAAVELAPGNSAGDINIALQSAPVFRVSGKVENFVSDSLGKRTRVLLAPRDMPPFSGLSQSASAQADGAFSLSDVINGSYTLWLVGSYSSVAESIDGRGGRRRVLARQDVDVNGGDVGGLSLALMPPVNLKGRVVLEDAPANPNLAQLRVILRPLAPSGGGSTANTMLASDGSFSFAGLDPAEYSVRVAGLQAGMYVAEISLNRQDVSATGLDLSTGGGGGDLDVVIRGGAGEVGGSVAGDRGEPATNGVALLIPETPAPDGSTLLTGILQPGGVFAIGNVKPGRYFAFALADWDSIWQNADFQRAMQRAGTAVQVAQNSHTQLQLRLMPPAEIESGAQQLGLSLQ